MNLNNDKTELYIHNTNELFLLKNIFNGANKQHIKDYFKKKNINFREYKEGSPKWIAQEEEKKELASIPNYKVVIDVHSSIEFSLLKKPFPNPSMDFAKGYIEEMEEIGYYNDWGEYSNEEGELTPVRYYFLIDSTSDKYPTILTSMEDVFTLPGMINKILKDQIKEKQDNFWRAVENSKDEPYYYIVRDLVNKALSRGADIRYNDKSIFVDEQIFEKSYLDKVIKAKYYWNELGEKIEFGRTYLMSRIQEYERYKDSIMQ